MLSRNSRKNTACICLAASLLIQTNLACFANDLKSVSVVASPGGKPPVLNTDFGEIPIAQDMLVVATASRANAEQSDDTASAEKTTNDTADTETSTTATSTTNTSTADPASPEEAPLGTKQDDADSSHSKTAIAQADPERPVLRGDSGVTPLEAVTQVDVLTSKILLKEIELQRYNLHYTLEVAKQGRWKGWRYAFFQEINSGMGLSGSIISVANRGQALHKPSRVRLRSQLTANYVPMIGSIIGAGAAAGEFGINSYHEVMARAHGFSPAAAVRKVTGLQNDIDTMLAKRESLMRLEGSDPSLQGHVVVDEVEGRILKDVRDQSIQEFERYHIGARKTIAFQQSQYLFDVAKNTTNAIGCNWAYLSLINRHRIWNGRAGVMFTISGQLTCFAPILSRLIGKGYGEFTKLGMKNLSKEAKQTDIAKLSADLDDLEAILKARQASNPEVASAVEMQGNYDSHERVFTDEIRAAEKKVNASKLTATQNIGAGLFVGGLKTASGVLFLVPGFNPNYNRNNARSSQVTNDLLFTSGVLGLPAGVFSMLDTLRIQVQGEINRHKAAKAGKLPGQIATARLKELDQMELRLKAAK